MTLLSICIPCYGRVEYVRKTLKSIFIDNADVPLEKYEVIISDNDSNQAIKVLTEEFKYPNLRYFYTNCEGFMNSYYVLTYAQGEFFKLHNSQTLFRKGSLSKIISEIKNNIENKTLIFYFLGFLYQIDCHIQWFFKWGSGIMPRSTYPFFFPVVQITALLGKIEL